MVQCTCGKTIDKVPNWLQGVTVEFVCNNCPTRQVKKITEVQIQAPAIRTEDEQSAIDKLDEDDES